ncbi:MAG: ATP synthase F1 subunit delta [Candidatus Riflebacteria bacterium]|nr:ATP synthase F1 subunit delta [Candidatus Riflebacteria bacterium]
MKTQILARRYAEAFFKVISSENSDEVYSDLLSFADLIEKRRDLESYFLNPLVSVDQKIDLLKKAVASSSSKYLADFLCLLVKRFRFSLLDQIAQEFEHIYFRSKNIVEVTVKSAIELNDHERKNLIEKLGKKITGGVRITEKIDPLQKGGLLVCYGDHIYDSTIKNKLKLLDERLNALTREILSHVEEAPTSLNEGKQP